MHLLNVTECYHSFMWCLLYDSIFIARRISYKSNITMLWQLCLFACLSAYLSVCQVTLVYGADKASSWICATATEVTLGLRSIWLPLLRKENQLHVTSSLTQTDTNVVINDASPLEDAHVDTNFRFRTNLLLPLSFEQAICIACREPSIVSFKSLLSFRTSLKMSVLVYILNTCRCFFYYCCI